MHDAKDNAQHLVWERRAGGRIRNAAAVVAQDTACVDRLTGHSAVEPSSDLDETLPFQRLATRRRAGPIRAGSGPGGFPALQMEPWPPVVGAELHGTRVGPTMGNPTRDIL